VSAVLKDEESITVAGFEAWLAGVTAEPWRYDFYQAMRHIEAAHPHLPRLGEAQRPGDEPLRVSQPPELNFAPASLHGIQQSSTGVLRLQQRIFGLIGPNGPLPIHLTEYVRERAMHAGDTTLLRFLDLLTHRFALLFYRAWAQAQPTVSLDRPKDDRFSIYVGALCGLGDAGLRERDAVQDCAKLFYAGLLSRHVRNSDGLVALLSGYFRLPVSLEPFVGHWMTLADDDRTRLAGQPQQGLGQGAVLGRRVWDRQHKFRLCLGPLELRQLEEFLPGGRALAKLVAWVRQYLCFELEWDVRLVLKREQVPPARLGKFQRLGWSTWVGTRARTDDARDLVLDAERLQAALTAKGNHHG